VKKNDRNMKIHIFETTKILNPINKIKIDKNRNITLQNHIGMIPLDINFKPQPFGTNKCSLNLKNIQRNIKCKT
jgi:hypothetical protein